MTQNIKFINKFPDEQGFKLTCEQWLQIHQNRNDWLLANQNQNIIIDCQLPQMALPKHWGTLSLKFVWKGGEYYETSKGIYLVKHDRFLLLNEGTKYSSRVIEQEKVESFTIHFNPLFWKEVTNSYFLPDNFLLDNPFSQIEPDYIFSEELYPHNNETIELCNQIRLSLRNGNPEETNEFLSKLLKIIIYSQKSVQKRILDIQATKKSTQIEIYRRVTIAKDYLLSCYDQKITLNDLGKMVAMSPHYLSRHFIRHFKKTPYQFLTEVRLQEAKKMCLSKEKNVSEICREVGFEDLSSFGKLFRKRFGQPPSGFSITGNNSDSTSKIF